MGSKPRKPARPASGTVVEVAGLKLRIARAPQGDPRNGIWGYPASAPAPTLANLMYLGKDRIGDL